MNFITIKKRSAFTLLEILIATTIFSIVMIMTSGIIAESSSYKEKIATTRDVSIIARRLADQISRDMHATVVPGNVNYGLGQAEPGNVSMSFKKGIALFYCSAASGCTPKHFTANSINEGENVVGIGQDSTDLQANVFILFTKSDDPTLNLVRVYGSTDVNDGVVYYREVTIPIASALDINTLYFRSFDDDDIIAGESPSDGGIETGVRISFGGYGPDTNSYDKILRIQPYVNFIIESKTRGYDNLGPKERALSRIRSMVTVRNYDL